MKKLFAICIVTLMLLLLVGCNTEPRSTPKAEYNLRFIEGGYEYYYDDEYLMLFFEFTNNSGKTVAPWDLATVEAFQNGVELTQITFNGQRINDALAIDVSIKDGTTATVVWMFRPDDYSKVSIETSDGQKFMVG